ncbi:MAG: substrate-binding domain-containing protein, partial [Syntrophaceae bacterium]|nr:substrate-binding domain-containing protein [Syntrophaceae bacterium]
MKKLMSMLFSGLLALSMAGGAVAAPPAPGTALEINIYGASAQYLFWNDLGDDWMKANALPGANCDDNTVFQGTKDSIHGVTWGYNCQNINGTPDIVFRYTSKNSCGGLRAVACIADGDACLNSCERTMMDEQTCPPGGGACTGTKCIDVTHGAYDVEATSLVQSSSGEKKGRCGGGVISPGPCNAFPGGKTYQPTVVPFGFFLNNAVTQTLCTANPNPLQIGQPCSGATCANGSGTCGAPAPVQDISRMTVAMIYAVQAFQWRDFGASFPANLPIEACLRHAGSGTHATLDLAVMRGTGPLALNTFEIPGASGYGLPNATAPASTYAQWFNEGSSDMMRCVNGNWWVSGSGTCSGSGQSLGAIGYADADQTISAYSNVYGPVKYNGYKPLAQNIRWGLYDNFWSTQWIYEDCVNPQCQIGSCTAICQDAAAKLMAFAEQNIPSSK